MVISNFYHTISMLRMNDINDDIEYFFGKMDEEFQILESVIKNALEKIQIYEKTIEQNELE